MELLCYQLLPCAHPDRSLSAQAQLGGLSSPFSCSLAGDLAGPADTCDVLTCSVHAAATPQRPSDPPQPSPLQLPKGQRPQARALGPLGDTATVLQTGSLDGVSGAVTKGLHLEAPDFGGMFSYRYLDILKNSEQWTPRFHFALSPANYVAGPAYSPVLEGMWLSPVETCQTQPQPGGQGQHQVIRQVTACTLDTM